MPRTTTSRRHGAVVPLAIAVAFRRWTILRVLSNCKGLRITFYSVRHLRLPSLSPSQGPSRRNRTLAMCLPCYFIRRCRLIRTSFFAAVRKSGPRSIRLAPGSMAAPSIQWFENEREGGEAGAGGLAAPVLSSFCSHFSSSRCSGPHIGGS